MLEVNAEPVERCVWDGPDAAVPACGVQSQPPCRSRGRATATAMHRPEPRRRARPTPPHRRLPPRKRPVAAHATWP